MYQPLPYNVTVSTSTIHGIGLFAKFHIEENTQLGLLHVYINKEIIRTPLAGFLNHNDNPNCIKIIKPTDTGPRSFLVTNKVIIPGEELTIKYDLYKP